MTKQSESASSTQPGILEHELHERIERYKHEIAKRKHADTNSLEWRVRIEFEAQFTECEDLLRLAASRTMERPWWRWGNGE
jgi:hypothetical protein